MCRSMADIRSTAAEIRRGKKRKMEEEDRKKLQGKNIMAPLLHRAAIKTVRTKDLFNCYFNISCDVLSKQINLMMIMMMNEWATTFGTSKRGFCEVSAILVPSLLYQI